MLTPFVEYSFYYDLLFSLKVYAPNPNPNLRPTLVALTSFAPTRFFLLFLPSSLPTGKTNRQTKNTKRRE
jgi:hypothetical protein